MTQSCSAAIHIRGPTIRFATVGHEDGAQALRHVGREEIGIDVTRALWEGQKESEVLDRVGAALRNAISEEVSSVRIVVHPLDVYSFFTPIPVGASEEDRRRYATHQAALVTGARSPETLRLSLQSVRTVEVEGEHIEWVHVLALPRAVAERMDTLGEAFPSDDQGRIVSTDAAARLAAHAEGDEPNGEMEELDEGGSPYTLAIGAYDEHTEYTLTHNRSWFHAHAAQEARAPENRAFYAVGFLNRTRVSPEAVGRVFVYGDDAAESALDDLVGSLFECASETLNPFEVIGLTSASVPEDPADRYVPCVGGALDALV